MTVRGIDRGETPSTRTITAGTGLTGGGDLSADRTIALDPNVSITTASISGTTTLAGQLDLTGVQTSTATGTQDDFALSSTTSILRWAGASTMTLDGLTGGVTGRILIIEVAPGANTSVVLVNEAAGSTASNRIYGISGSNVTLAPNNAGASANASAILVYDGTSSRWRVVACSTATVGAFTTFTAGLTSSGATSATGLFTAAQRVILSGVASPAALSGSTNDYAIPALSLNTIVRQDVSSAATVTGIAAAAAGTTIILTNIATATANTLTFSNESTSSSAANRLTLLNGTSLVLGPGASTILYYDGTSSRWRTAAQLTTSPAGSGSPDGVLTGAAGQLYTDTTTLVVWQNTDGATAWDPVFIPLKAGSQVAADYMFSADSGVLGAGTFASSGEQNEAGIKTCSMSVSGVDGVQSAMFANYGNSLFGGGVWRSRVGVRIATLSDGTNNLIVRACLHDSNTAADVTDGAYLEYDYGGHSSSQNWWLCTANNSTRTKTDTGIAAVASSTTFQTLAVKVNAAGTSASATVNGVAAASPNTTNIPTGAGRSFAAAAFLTYKSLGAGALTAAFGFWDYYNLYTTQRST